MTQLQTIMSFSRRKGRQLWLIVMTILMAANAFLLLFAHKPCDSPGHLSEEHSSRLNPENPSFYPHYDYPDTREPPQLKGRGADTRLEDLLRPAEKPEQFREKVVDKIHEASNSRDTDLEPQPNQAIPNDPEDKQALPDPQLNQAIPNDPKNKQALPSPQLVETVGDKILGDTMNVAENVKNEKLLKPGDVVPKLQVKNLAQRPDKEVTPLQPWLYKPDNLTRLEQVIHSLQVVTDEDRDSIEQSPYFQPQASIVTSFIPKVLIDSVHCPAQGPTLLIVIASVWANFRVRQAIRDTWASPAYGGEWPGDPRNFTSLFKVVFFIGRKTMDTPPALVEEARKFQDIVMLDFQDSYLNLTLKISLALEWSSHRCPGAGHVMKVDEDTFMQVPLLLDVLQSISDPKGFMLGFIHKISKPPVLRKGRWGVPRSLFPLSRFPRYFLGPSYLFSSKAVRKIGKVWRYMPLVPNDDAFLTGILAKVTSVTRIHSPWIAKADRKTDAIPRKELINGRSLSQTGFKPFSKLFPVWEMVKKAAGGFSKTAT